MRLMAFSQSESTANDKVSKSTNRPGLSVNSSLSSQLESCGVNRKEEREIDRERERGGGDVCTCSAALVCVTGIPASCAGSTDLGKEYTVFQSLGQTSIEYKCQLISRQTNN